MSLARWIGVAIAAGGVAFGFVGGEYSTMDWLSLRNSVDGEQEAVSGLRQEIDSLTAEAEALETDPVAQEREARRRFGMLRDGELMYRVRRSIRKPEDEKRR